MYIFILATPVIIKNPESVVTKENSEVFLECSAHDYGVGSIQFRWEKYQQSSNTWVTPKRLNHTMSPKLLFNMIKEEDQGMYHCVAINTDGSVISKSANITVYGEVTEELSDVYTVKKEEYKMCLIEYILCSMLIISHNTSVIH